MRRILLIALLVAAGITPFLVLSAQTLGPPKSNSRTFVISPNDVLSVFVWKEPTLSGKFIVRPDGKISVPLVKDVQAAGLDPVQLGDKIEEGLKQFIDVPNVTVVVEEIKSYRVFVTGHIAKPGDITSPTPISILQALALAGGTTDYANLSQIAVFRNSGEETVMYKFNYPEVIKGVNYTQNMMLRSGDVVVVP